MLTTPWALWGLLAVPALVAIYWLRKRFRQMPVSSLMLWRDQKEAKQGGFRIRRLQTPLLFFLELLALVLLVGAAAGPSVSMPSAHRPLVVILDDSYSMQAGGDDSPRKLAEKALLEELDRGIRYSV
ncbi:MAG TPA: BatA domain-containing protein, partial [Gemmataceae bacterium]|nr:BatA domain-containing protein [Gemmataceae bacterium]